jgi:hypothetical protein
MSTRPTCYGTNTQCYRVGIESNGILLRNQQRQIGGLIQMPRLIEFGGRRWTVTEWAAELGVDRGTLYWRLNHLPLGDALQSPPEVVVCEGCGGALPQGSRASQRYHNEACKQRAYRDRK